MPRSEGLGKGCFADPGIHFFNDLFEASSFVDLVADTGDLLLLGSPTSVLLSERQRVLLAFFLPTRRQRMSFFSLRIWEDGRGFPPLRKSWEQAQPAAYTWACPRLGEYPRLGITVALRP